MKFIAPLFLSLTILSSMALASDKAGKNRKGKGRGQFKELNLTEAQLAKVKEFRKSNKGKMKSLRGEIKATREKIQTSFLNDSSPSELAALHNKMKELRSKMAEVKFSKMLMLKTILNKEQRAKFINSQKSRRGKRQR